jgi:lactate dehydrogenase-like 2-hydroxyacid dehydrogenase
MIRFARAFETTVVVTDVHWETYLQKVVGFRYVPLDELLRVADITTLRVPLTPADRTHLFESPSASVWEAA